MIPCRRSLLLVIGGAVAGALLVGILQHAWMSRQTMQSWMVMIIDGVRVASKIRDDDSQSVVADLDRNLDDRITFADQILRGEYRTIALWEIKDYASTHAVPLSASSRTVLDALPRRPMNHCEANGSCSLRPSVR